MYYCPQCRNEILIEAHFCDICGYRLDDRGSLVKALTQAALPPKPKAVPQVHPPRPTRTIRPQVAHQQSGQTPPPDSQPNHQFMRPAFISPQEKKPDTSLFSSQQMPQNQARHIQARPVPDLDYPNEEQMPLIAQVAPSLSTQPEQAQRLKNLPTGQLTVEVIKGKSHLKDIQERSGSFENDESFVATSLAAERWRTSWRNRQRTEAGPATIVARGHSPVPEPLLAMQNSLLRMRALIGQKNGRDRSDPGFWITIILMVCIIGGLGAYIIAMYLPITGTSIHVNTSLETPLPALTIQGTPLATITQEQMLHLHGEHFHASAHIIFIRDGTTAITGSNDRAISSVASNQGTFNVALPVTPAWSLGNHQIQAQDNISGQSAYLNIQVILPDSTTFSSPDVSLSTPNLTFQAVIGQGNPKEQFVTLTNISKSTPLKWTATTQTDGNESWLVIDESTTSGSLNVGGSGRVGIRATITGLKSNDKPYTGRFLFTINQVQQLTLPVQLYMQDGVAELVISPVHIVSAVSPTNTCLPGAQLTLINISNSRINWKLNMDDTTVQHIQFIYQGKLVQQGQLATAGVQGNTQVLTMNCAYVQAGNTFLFTVYANNIPSLVTVSIQAPS